VEQGKNKEVLVAAFHMDGRIPSNAAEAALAAASTSSLSSLLLHPCMA
jgi:hypothetical protein